MAINGYLKFVKKMWYAPLVWAGASGQLAYDFLRSPSTFWPGDRAAKRIDQPVEDGLTHRTLKGANGIRLHTVTTGDTDKPLMLLLHGFPELWTMWEHQMSEFRDEYNVAAIDMRGYGGSDRPTARRDYYIDVLVEDVVAVIRALGYKTCVLAGHDWGGKVAWTVAHIHMDMIDRLVIISAPHPTSWTENFSLRQSIKSSYFQLFYAPWLAELYVLHNDVSLIDMALLYPPSAPRNPTAISGQEVDYIKDSMCQGINAPRGISSASAMLNYYRGWVDNETWRPVALVEMACAQMLKVPTMLLIGDSDPYFRREMWQHLDRHVQNCWLPAMLKNCSHWCPQDSPSAVNELIREFLGRKVIGFQADVGAPGAPEAINPIRIPIANEEECLETTPDKAVEWLQNQLDKCEPGRVFCMNHHRLAELDSQLKDKLTGMLVDAGCICTSSTPDMLVYESLLDMILTRFNVRRSGNKGDQQAGGSKDKVDTGQPDKQSGGDVGAVATADGGSTLRSKAFESDCTSCMDVELTAEPVGDCFCQEPGEAAQQMVLNFQHHNLVVRKEVPCARPRWWCFGGARNIPAAVVDVTLTLAISCCKTEEGHVCVKISNLSGQVWKPRTPPAGSRDGSQGTYLQQVQVQLNMKLGNRPCLLDMDLNTSPAPAPAADSASSAAAASAFSQRRDLQMGRLTMDYYRVTHEGKSYWEAGGQVSVGPGSVGLPIPKVGRSTDATEKAMISAGYYTLAYATACGAQIKMEAGSVGTTLQLCRDLDLTLISDARDSAKALTFHSLELPIRFANASSPAWPEEAISISCRVAMKMSMVPGHFECTDIEAWQPLLTAGWRTPVPVSFEGAASSDSYVRVRF